MEELNKIKTSNLKIGSILIIVFILIYVPSLYHWVYGIDINTDIIRNGTLEDAINADGFLVREESTFTSPYTGTYIPEIMEGEKIPVNFNIATVLKRSSEELLKQLEEIDLNIIKTQKKKNENVNIFSDDINKIDSEIIDKLKLVINAGNSNNIDIESNLHDGIDTLIQKKASIIGNTSTSDQYINTLKKQKDDLQNRIKLNTNEIKSKTSGIISFNIDGYENLLTPESIKGITPKLLESIKINAGTNNFGNKSVEAQKPFAKIIKDFEYNILVILDKNKIKDLKKDREVSVRINEINKVLNGKVDFISKSYGGKYIISFKLDQCISELASIRRTNIDLIIKKNSFSGFKIPINSLKEIDLIHKKAKIVIVDANYATIKDVAIIGNDNEYAIIDNINKKDKNGIGLYDIYVTKPGNIKEGQIINQ